VLFLSFFLLPNAILLRKKKKKGVMHLRYYA
jgi:hypothetical protein